MGHKNKQSLFGEMKQSLDAKLCIGESKHDAKIAARAMGKINGKTHKVQIEGIYSWSTYRNYLKHGAYFIDYCKQQYGCSTLQDCRCHVDDWIQSRIDAGLSAWTIKLEVSAVAKIYGTSADDVVTVLTPSRVRKDIKRSRQEAVRDAHFNPDAHPDLVYFALATGMRREGLETVKGTSYRIDDKGQMWVSIREKGGKWRFIPISMQHKDRVRTMMDAAGSNKVFESVPVAMDVHGYRGQFATALYRAIARPVDKIPRKDRYCCRKDRKGIVLDRKAMFLVSQALGHSRVDVISGHYLYDLSADVLQDVFGDTLYRQEMYPGIP